MPLVQTAKGLIERNQLEVKDIVIGENDNARSLAMEWRYIGPTDPDFEPDAQTMADVLKYVEGVRASVNALPVAADPAELASAQERLATAEKMLAGMRGIVHGELVRRDGAVSILRGQEISCSQQTIGR